MRNAQSPSLQLIAEQAGVSVPTVSRVLGGKGSKFRISKTTQENIKRIAAELKYTPNKVARGLRLRCTNTVGLLIPDISNPFFANIARSIENSMRRFDYSIILCDTRESTEVEAESISLLRSRMVDGLIIVPVGQSPVHLRPLESLTIPVVFVDRCFPGLEFSFVKSDNYTGALEATRHLIEYGHTRIGCIQGLRNTSPNEDRVKGFKDALTLHRLPVDESLIVGDSFGEVNGYVSAKLLLKRMQPPTAILAVSNLISLGALRAIAEERLTVPDDVSLVSFDDQPYSAFLETPMTTVAQQSDEMGHIAAKLLIEQIQTGQLSGGARITLPTKLIVRQSVKRIAQRPQQTA